MTTSLVMPTDSFRALPVPLIGARTGTCYVRVTDLPQALDKFMGVNPRCPARTKAGVLSGSVIKGILQTLRDDPESMSCKNQGIYILTQQMHFSMGRGGKGILTLTLSDPAKHGIINGGHTYAAIREAVDTADKAGLETLKRAYVQLHLYEGIPGDMVPQIAEGLNRSKQVDDPSLANLRGTFDAIKQALSYHPAADTISYHQGDKGDVDVSEVLTYLAFFHTGRFTDQKQPHQFYKRPAAALHLFAEDKNNKSSPMPSLIAHLPDILWLVDNVRKTVPEAARKVPFDIGRMKVGGQLAGADKFKNIKLPFTKQTMGHRIPNGWIYPMVAAFRANLMWDNKTHKIKWRMPLADLLPHVMIDLVRVCVTELRDNGLKPEQIGSRESVYRQCYDKVSLYLAKKGLL